MVPEVYISSAALSDVTAGVRLAAASARDTVSAS